eukprot:12458423-Alexandrium_andersonii.AAC.1
MHWTRGACTRMICVHGLTPFEPTSARPSRPRPKCRKLGYWWIGNSSGRRAWKLQDGHSKADSRQP